MPKDKTPTGDDAGTTPAAEPRNVVVRALKDRTKLGKAIVAAGRVDFRLTQSEADAAVAAGLVVIEGIDL